jgi:stearoyl-CoA desaturase (delta-9 desaturase)
MFGFGWLLNHYAPSLHTSGAQMLTWGFFVSTTLLYHGTFTINSVAHIFGRRRFATNDTSRNSFVLSLITLGEGWHNNHHRYPASERQGFYWWEIDITHYILKAMSWARLVWDLREPPEYIYGEAKRA